MEFGMSQGLAYVHDWKAQHELSLQNEQLDRQASMDAQNKAKWWADKLKNGKAYTAFGKAQLDKHFQEGVTKIGELVNSHPDWESNVEILGQINQLSDGLSDNDITNRELRAEQSRQQLLKDQASGEYDISELQDQIDRYQNFATHGNASGDPSKGIEEFMYTSPTKFDSQAYMMEVASKLKYTTRFDKSDPTGIMKIEEVDPNDLIGAANSIIGGRFGKKYMKQFEQMKGVYKTPQEMVIDGLKAFTGTQRDFNFDPNYTARLKAAATGNDDNSVLNPYDTYAKGYLSPTYKADATVYGISNLLNLTEDGKGVTPGKSGAYVQKESGEWRTMPWTANKTMEYVGSSNRIRHLANGTKVIEYTGRFGASGHMLGNDIWTGNVEDSTPDKIKEGQGAIPGDEIAIEYRKKVRYELDKEGNRTGYILMDLANKIDGNPTIAQQSRFNQLYMGTKEAENKLRHDQSLQGLFTIAGQTGYWRITADGAEKVRD